MILEFHIPRGGKPRNKKNPCKYMQSCYLVFSTDSNDQDDVRQIVTTIVYRSRFCQDESRNAIRIFICPRMVKELGLAQAETQIRRSNSSS